MLVNEHWLWLGDRVSPEEAGLTIYKAHPGAWWIAVGTVMIGPIDDRAILRSVRVACTPTIDGCELGPHQLGVRELEPRRPLQRGPKWQAVSENELPQSVTEYDREALEPVSGCCTTSDAKPKIDWGNVDDSRHYTDERSKRGGTLASTWNAHPKGSPLFLHGPDLDAGFVIIDAPAT